MGGKGEMRKRFMNLSKRCMAAIMSAAFIMLSVAVSMTLSVEAYAGQVNNNPEGETIGILGSNTSLNVNEGTVNTMKDQSNVGTNKGRVGKMIGDSCIGINDGDVTTMSVNAKINTNKGSVSEMNANASIVTNNGNVSEMSSNTKINTNTNNGNVSKMISSASIDINNGSVSEMSGLASIDTNNGSVSKMSGHTKINTNTNNGNVSEMCENASIDINNGSVSKMSGYAKIDINNGNVSEMREQATVTNTSTGKVENNYANVNGEGTVTNCYGGQVSGTVKIENYFNGTIQGNGVTVTNNFSTQQIGSTNQFYSVDFTAPEAEDGTRSYGKGFITKNYNEYVQVTGTNAQPGVITISPASGKKITGNERSGSTNSFEYSLIKQSDGSFILKITPKGNVTGIGLETFGLAICQAIEEQNNVTIAQVTVNSGDDSNNNDGNSNGDVGAPSQEQSVETTLLNLIRNSKQTAGKETVIIDFKTNTWISPRIMQGLLEINGNTKDCYFTLEGIRYVLHIPATNMINAEKRAAAFEALKNEEGGGAGFKRIAQLFSECGVWYEEVQP